MMTVEREFHAVAIAKTEAVEWYCERIAGRHQHEGSGPCAGTLSGGGFLADVTHEWHRSVNPGLGTEAVHGRPQLLSRTTGGEISTRRTLRMTEPITRKAHSPAQRLALGCGG
jgi:hypothetical protein